MNPNIWVIGDTHFGHRKLADGILRPWPTTEEMDRALIDRWNAVVADDDRVFHLGDFCINRRALGIIGKLRGRKVLIKGNHDTFRLNEYTGFPGAFENVEGSVVFSDCILTHIPIHPNQLARFKKNIHGHMHREVVRKQWAGEEFDGVPDVRYFCASVELIGYQPVRLSEILTR